VIAIRAATLDDLPALTALYNHYVEHTHVTFDVAPFSIEQRRPWLDQFSGGPHRLLVAVDDGLIGYAGSARFRPRPAYDTTVELSFYCAPQATRRGVGRALLGALLDQIAGEDLHRAVGAVALPNPGSVALLERFGFRSVGVLSEVGRKFGKYWDVQQFEKELRR
jgi:phosphinothricin acetyltransferase